LSDTLNDSFGAQNWARYWWYTPKVSQILHLMFLAPNWTLSSFNAAGGGLITGQILGNTPSKMQRNFMVRRYWPAMIALALVGMPNVLQAAIYGAAGDDDEDDVPFTWMNEKGKKMHIDITPLMRKLPWYDGDKSGKRRVFARFGKQAYEVWQGWYKQPLNTALRKMSIPARVAYEQLTGVTPGTNWDTSFRGAGIQGLFFSEDGGFKGSRAYYMAKNLVPMSLQTALEYPDKLPVNFITAVSKGASFGNASYEYAKVLKAYADHNTWEKVKGSPEAKSNLKAMGRDILEAAARNGFDPDKVVSSARGVVLAPYYEKFFNALEDRDSKKMKRVANSIIRLNGDANSTIQSMKNKLKISGDTLPAEWEEAIKSAFQ